MPIAIYPWIVYLIYRNKKQSTAAQTGGKVETMKKRVAVPGWFGEITPEEIEAIRGKYAEFEKKIADYQKRPIEPTTTDNKKED